MKIYAHFFKKAFVDLFLHEKVTSSTDSSKVSGSVVDPEWFSANPYPGPNFLVVSDPDPTLETRPTK